MSDNSVLYEIGIELDDALANVDKLLEKLNSIEKFGQTAFAKSAKEITDAANAMGKLAQQSSTAARSSKQQSDSYLQIRDALRALRGEQQAQEKASRAQEQVRKRASAEALRTIKTFAAEREGLLALANAYGRFTVKLDDNAAAASDAERQARKLINSNEILRRELEAINRTANGGTSVQLSRANLYQRPRQDEFLNAFQIRELAREFDNLGLRGAATFGGLFSILGPVGIAIAALGLATGGVIALFAKLGVEGGKALNRLVKDGEEAAVQLDAIRASFRGIFEGNEDVADAVVNKLREESKRLGIDIQSIVRQVLPLAESLEQAVTLSEFAVGLARRDPKVGEEGATRALQAATAGNLEPLRRTFDIDVTKIRQAQEELGLLQGLIAGLGPILADLGLDIESQANTFSTQSGRMKQAYQEFLQVLGGPIVTEKTAQLVEFNDLLARQGDNAVRVSASIGTAVAQVIQSVGDLIARVIEGLDDDSIARITSNILRTGEELAILFDVITQSVGDTRDTAGTVARAIDLVNENIAQATRNIALLKAVIAAAKSEAGSLIQLMTSLATGDILGSSDAFADLFSSDIGDTFMADLRASFEIISQGTQRIEEAREENDRYVDSILNISDASLEEADNILEANSRARQLAEAYELAAEAREKINEAIDDYNLGKDRAYQDLLRDQTRKTLDIEEDFLQKRRELRIKYLEDIAAAERKFYQGVRDLAIDLSRAEQDAILKAGRQRVDAEREVADKRADIELDYQRKIAEIRRGFEFDAEEAIRNNDAVAYLRLRRQLNRNLDEARIKRDEDIEDARRAAEKKRDVERVNLERQLEDARIANQRRLEDLRRNLEDQLSELDIRYNQEVEKQARAEEEKRAEQKKSFDRQLEDFNEYWRRRRDDMIKNYQEELEIVRKYEQLIAQTQARSRRSTRYAQNPGELDRFPPPPPRGDQLPTPGSGGGGGGAARQFGGAAPLGRYTLVGERGPELVRFTQPASVIPTGRSQQIITSSNQTINTLNLPDGLSGLTPAQITQVQGILVAMLRMVQ